MCVCVLFLEHCVCVVLGRRGVCVSWGGVVCVFFLGDWPTGYEPKDLTEGRKLYVGQTDVLPQPSMTSTYDLAESIATPPS